MNRKRWLLLAALFLPLLSTQALAERVFVKPGSGISALSEGAKFIKRFRYIDWELWDADGSALSVSDRMNTEAGGKVAVPDEPVYLFLTPNDSAYTTLWHHHNTGQSGGTVDADIDTPDAWDITTGNGTVLVGMVDTGCKMDHPDLAANIWTNPGEIPGNSIDDDANGYIDDVHGWDFAHDDNDPTDYYFSFHGTNTAGVVAAIGNNGIGVAGVAWNVKIVPLKMYSDQGAGSVAFAIEAYEYCITNGIRVNNNSWGVLTYSQPLADAVAAATSAGVLTVCATGNNAWNVDCCSLDQCKAYPAALPDPGIIAVGATDRKDIMASYSNHGSVSCDLFAPGSNIISTTNGGYATNSGTSLAAPMVTATVALLLSVRPELTATEVKALILNNVDAKASLSGKCVTGGRLNVYRTLIASQNGGGGGGDPVEQQSVRQVIRPWRDYDVQGRRTDGKRSGVVFSDSAGVTRKRAVVR